MPCHAMPYALYAHMLLALQNPPDSTRHRLKEASASSWPLRTSALFFALPRVTVASKSLEMSGDVWRCLEYGGDLVMDPETSVHRF